VPATAFSRSYYAFRLWHARRKALGKEEDAMIGLGRVLWMSVLIGGIAWLSAPSIAHSAPDGVALIETTVPLKDTSDAGIADAVNRAVTSAVRGAVAMGLSWVQLQRAYVSGGYVSVQVLAATESLDSAAQDETGATPDIDRGNGDRGNGDRRGKGDRRESGTLTRL